MSKKERNLSSQQTLHAFIQASPLPLMIIGNNGRVKMWNPASERVFGWKSNEVIGKVLPIVPINKRKESFTYISQTQKGKVLRGIEAVRVKKDGSSIDIALWTAPLGEKKQKEQDILVIIDNITQRKRAENQQVFLIKTNEILSSSLDYKKTLSRITKLIVPNLADWASVEMLDSKGTLRQLAIAHTNPKKIILAKKLRREYPTNLADPEGIAKVIRTGKAACYPEITDKMLRQSAKTKKQFLLWKKIGFTSAMIVPLQVRGKTLGVINFVSAESGKRFTTSDFLFVEEIAKRAALFVENARLYQEVRIELEQRKRFEEELKKSRDQLEIIFKSVADGITVQDPSGKIIYANDAAAYAIGFHSPEALMRSPVTSIMKNFTVKDEKGNPFPSDRLPGRRALKGELRPEELICYTSLLTGEENWSITKARPVFDERGNVLYAINVFHDITERKKLEERKDDFISIASHELKTPITSVKAFTQILQKRFIKAGDEESGRYLSKMDTQLNKLTNLIRDLLDINKIQTGRLAFHKEIFYFDSLLDEIIEDFQRMTKHTIIKKGNCHLRIDADRDRLSQVIINLLSNAIKYSPQADKIFIYGEKKNGKLLFSVKDFGIGIPKEHYKKIFGRFFRGVDSKKETFPGLGVGLYISSEIIKRHNGKIWVESREGEGSTFYFSIPIVS